MRIAMPSPSLTPVSSLRRKWISPAREAGSLIRITNQMFADFCRNQQVRALWSGQSGIRPAVKISTKFRPYPRMQ
jgi:hypothetical protein